MGGCLTTEKFDTQPNQARSSAEQAGQVAGESRSAVRNEESAPATIQENMTVDSADAKKLIGVAVDNPSSASSVASPGRGAPSAGASPLPEGSFDKLVPSSDGSKDPALSPHDVTVREPGDPTSGLTEQALKQVIAVYLP
jgi:hypothetical protein